MPFLLPLLFSGDPFHYERPEPSSDIDFWEVFKELVGFVCFIIALAAFVRNPLLTLSLIALAFTGWLAWKLFVKG